jgi:hypothetical protein
MRAIGIFLFILLLNASTRCEQFTYLSPGFLLGINLDGEFFCGPKLSYGVAHSKGFRNITIGYLIESATKHKSLFLEGQAAKYTKPVLIGGGLGISVPLNVSDDSWFSIRISAFSGYAIFVNNTLQISNSINDQINCELVAPFPMPLKAVGGGG